MVDINIKTWNAILDKWLIKDNRTIGFFDNIKSLPKNANEWNRAIIINWNSREYQSGKWIDLGEFLLPIGEQWLAGKDWIDWLPGQAPDINEVITAVLSKIKLPKDGLNWRDGNDVDQADTIKKLMTLIRVPLDGKDGKDGLDGKDAVIDYKTLISSLLSNKDFLVAVRWESGKDGKDGVDGKAPTLNEVVAAIISNKTFLEKVTIEGPAGKDGVAPSLNDILYAIKNDKLFIEQCTVVGPQWPAMKFEDLTEAQLEKIKWEPGESMPGPMWWPGVPGDRVYIQYSPDGKSDWSYKIKEWDMYISIQVGKQAPQITQFIFK